jgi:TPR repeat protein
MVQWFMNSVHRIVQMYIFQPRTIPRKVELQLATPQLPSIINDATDPLPSSGTRSAAKIRGLTPPEIYRLAKAIYHRGVSVQEDLEEAIFYFKTAAEMNFPPAQNYYAMCLSQSLDPETAVYGYFATINLGTQDFVKREMIRNFTLAADAGHKRALNHLGMCYIQGRGVPVDTDKGLELLSASKALGDVLGSKNYDTYVANAKSRRNAFAFS